MAKKRKGKRKGYRGKKSKARGVKRHKPGLAESVGIAATALKVGKTAVPEGVALIKHPSTAGLETWATNAWYNTKQNSEPAIVGILVSNADKIPIIGRMVRPTKRKMDKILKSYTGMGL